MSTIAAIAAGDARFSVLVQALQFVDARLPGTDLLGALSADGADLTVFAPTDAAFGRLAADLGFTGNIADEAAVVGFLTTALTAEILRDVILHHVSPGAKTAADVGAAASVATLNGASLSAEGPVLVDSEPDLINPSLIQTDVAASNGFVHVIDRVLLPFDLPGNDAPTITGLVAASGDFDRNPGDFDLLLRAVQAAGLGDALADPAADLTVFAPNDAAFLKLASALGFKGGTEAQAFDHIVEALTLLSAGQSPIPLLTDILLYHVAPESLQASQVLQRTAIDTLLGPDIGRQGITLVDADPDLANPRLVRTDIQAANGIVHVIDGVLIPADILRSDGANDVDFIISGNRGTVIATGADRDFVDANGGADLVFLGSGRDVGLGGAGRDVLHGAAGNDTLLGEADADILFGGAGADRIAGGTSHDFLRGGAGGDVFIFAAAGGHDRISDFRNGHDRIDLSALGIDSFADLAGKISDRFLGTTIDLGADGRITLDFVRAHQIDAGDFVFA